MRKETGSENSITVLRCTCDAQSLPLKGVLPVTDETDLHKNVLVEGAGDTGCQSLPLHRVCLKSKYVSGDVTVSIVHKRLIDGIDMLLGNGLAGGHVEICPVVNEKPVFAD